MGEILDQVARGREREEHPSNGRGTGFYSKWLAWAEDEECWVSGTGRRTMFHTSNNYTKHGFSFTTQVGVVAFVIS